MSRVATSTLGFSDVAPTSDVYQILTISEALMDFARTIVKQKDSSRS